MKKTHIIAACAAVLSANVALADQDVGCGFGTALWAGQSGTLPKLLAATTNGTFGNQTLGITFGTLGCSQGGVITSKFRLSMFTGSNLERLAQEMSIGEGESLNSLADLLSVPESKKAHFFSATKTNFDRIFAPENKTAGDIIGALQNVMREDKELAAFAG